MSSRTPKRPSGANPTSCGIWGGGSGGAIYVDRLDDNALVAGTVTDKNLCLGARAEERQ